VARSPPKHRSWAKTELRSAVRHWPSPSAAGHARFVAAFTRWTKQTPGGASPGEAARTPP
jgi:hypothetical protein